MADFPKCSEYHASQSRRFLVILTAVGTSLLLLWVASNRFVEIKSTLCTLRSEMEKIKKYGQNCGVKLNTYADLAPQAKPSCGDEQVGDAVTSRIRGLLQQALIEYSADKTGKTDFALESTGGSIVSTGCTEPFEPNTGAATLFGIPLCHGRNGPRQVIQPSMLPGECWAFKGCTGTVIIKLFGPVFINGVTLEHIPKSISPTNEIDTAPKDFKIFGLNSETDKKGHCFGQFTYDADGPPLQYFPFTCASKSYEFIKFKVLTNHGNPHFTCVYRLRVHGTLDTSNS